jgi:hypothetical protein
MGETPSGHLLKPSFSYRIFIDIDREVSLPPSLQLNCLESSSNDDVNTTTSPITTAFDSRRWLELKQP